MGLRGLLVRDWRGRRGELREGKKGGGWEKGRGLLLRGEEGM